MASPLPEPTSATREHHVHHHHRPLAELIAISTRTVHARLNKLIIARLPLALPPKAVDQSVYVSGLLHIAPIYLTFERLWRSILDAEPNVGSSTPTSKSHAAELPPIGSDHGPSKTQDVQSERARDHTVDTRIHSLLQNMYLPGLMRSDRLKADIASMTGWPDHVVEEQLRSIGQTGRLGEFTHHIKRAVENRPHVLLAYSYILYMALFAGGRFIRASLESFGEDFWAQVPSPIRPTDLPCQHSAMPVERASGLTNEELPHDDHNSHADHKMPLRFFHFQTPEDGEDLKREFKRRLVDSEGTLTDGEKHDIIQESVCIFENMTSLIHQLDEVCADSDQNGGNHGLCVNDFIGMINPISARLRDSVSVAKERSARSSRLSTSSEDSTCSIIKRAIGALRTESGSSEPSAQGQGAHPLIISMSGVELCPAFPKSVRFEKTLPKPARSPTIPTDDGNRPNTCLKSASRRPHGVHVVNWLMAVAFGAIVIGAIMSRRGSGNVA
ncbi:hypothetical protein B0J13DRAFT_497911 [Dactylonectria estremocensis]|uniref:Heme oxygenase-like protein n=1 Tax=Dactylonectria estremocensis TaxID=1079267 RepID=A0A9P9F3T2_9HYPO|nr:hypothetical protein B0J13DRAFT_497911 [Dactylonectria estremocensis]